MVALCQPLITVLSDSSLYVHGTNKDEINSNNTSMSANKQNEVTKEWLKNYIIYTNENTN